MMDFVERRAVEAGAQQLLGDLQYARSEAVQRNEPVAVTAGVDCHVVHLASATASCTAADGATVTPASAALKSVMLTGRPAVSASAENTLARVVFEPVGGTASFIGPDPGSAAASWLLRNSAGTAQARVSVNLGGRASACATGGGHLSSLPDCSP
jgi:Tfp pilus assembly protein FimT